MKQNLIGKLFAVMCLSCAFSANAGEAATVITVEKVAANVNYTRLAMTADHQTYFVDEVTPYELKDFAPPAGPIGVAMLQNAKSLIFTTLAGKWDGDWHPAPRNQYVFVLSGTVEVEVTSGEVRQFSSGDILLLEDTAGRGHDTRVVSDEAVRFAIVALPEAE
ncbi:MAG: hypothetical protein ACI9BW_003086 [Gammaproteobacteria bacterium]|jgi:hypothetical protein